MICKGEVLIESERLLPQAIGISAASSFSFLTTETPSAAFQSIIQETQGDKVTKTPKLKKTKTAFALLNAQQTDEAPGTSISPTIETGNEVKTAGSRDILLIPITLILLAPVIFLVIKRIREENR